MILRTDFAPTVWRGADGLTVQVRGYSDVLPRAGVTLRLLAENNEILGETTTDADGVGRFAAPLLHGEGPAAPRAVEVLGGDDYTMLDLSSAAFDLSDRGVTGLPHPGPLDAYVWLDRGIYRPGETVQVMALLRDDAGKPGRHPGARHRQAAERAGVPGHHARPRRPRHRSICRSRCRPARRPAPGGGGAGRSRPAADRRGRVPRRCLRARPDGGRYRTRRPVRSSRASRIRCRSTARFLYGAPAAGLTGQGQMRLLIDPAPFPALAGYRIGLAERDLRARCQRPEGARYRRAGPRDGRHRHPARARHHARAEGVDHHRRQRSVRPRLARHHRDPAAPGRQRSSASSRRSPTTRWTPAPRPAFDIAAVNPDGTRVGAEGEAAPGARAAGLAAGDARQPGALRDGVARRTAGDRRRSTSRPTRRSTSPRSSISAATGIEVLEDGGMAATSMRFRSGWVSSDSPDVPDQVDVSADRKAYAPGDTARIHIAPPFAGAGDAAGADRPRASGAQPGRARRTAPTSMCRCPPTGGPAPTSRCTCSAPPPMRNRAPAAPSASPGSASIPACASCRWRSTCRTNTRRARAPRSSVHTAPGAWVSLAAVDEGILRLTRFVSPDPSDHFLGRRTAGPRYPRRLGTADRAGRRRRRPRCARAATRAASCCRTSRRRR